jgi:uncharacterized protein (DUF2267 family)
MSTTKRPRTKPRSVHVTEITDRLRLTVVQIDQVDGPDATAVNADLADRVRSIIGPTVKQLDLPRIHVMAEGHRVLLHGDVATPEDAVMIEDLVETLPGVDVVESHLHVGLIASDTRPSEGVEPSSAMYNALMVVADEAGFLPRTARAAVRGALAAILDQIPPGERRHLHAHFPHDVMALLKPRRRIGDEGMQWKQPLGLEIDASLRGGISLDDAIVVVPNVISVLRHFVPEEDADVRASLSRHLREFWEEQS